MVAFIVAIGVPLLVAPWSSHSSGSRISILGARSTPPTPVTSGTPDPCNAPDDWVGAWTASPQDSSTFVPARPVDGDTTPDASRSSFTNQSFRMIVTPNLGGSQVRVRLSNRFGSGPVTFTSVHVARRVAGATVDAGSDHVVTFGGALAVTVPAGTVVVSDPVNLTVQAFHDLAVSFYVAGKTSLDVHLDAKQTQYMTAADAGNHTADTAGASFDHPVLSWLTIDGLDVLAPSTDSAVAVVGDSLTDGLGSTDDANARWTDDLARRALGSGTPISVLNAGMSGNQVAADNLGRNDLVRGAGLSAVDRIDLDALQQSGVHTVVVFVGINDLLAPTSLDPVHSVESGYQAMINHAHAVGVRIVGATLTPAGQSGRVESWRRSINEWIRTGGSFDSVIDLDAAVRDPHSPSRIAPGLTDEVVHLNDAGYRVLADSIDLAALRDPSAAQCGDTIQPS
jgi:lysophospholipase L1-like esterase